MSEVSPTYKVEPDALFTKWSVWLKTTEGEITWLAVHRHVFQEVRKIVRDNPRIQKPSAFYTWMENAYVTDITVRLRRQLDQDLRTVSFWNLLRALSEQPEAMSRQRYIAMYRGSVVERFADRDFDRFAIPGEPHIDAALVKKDLALLEDAWNVVKEYINRRITHTDQRDASYLPKFDDLDKCQDLLEELLIKYTMLFTGANLMHVLPVFQNDWQAVFREPWIAQDNEAE